ncbi:hypothetical protein GQ53DRAFT_740555 [Thozetella sp. PMI_491]|nr:hypothetical protein GQ53DRAFT_740555 [Thozetella sp. PMI_491]
MAENNEAVYSTRVRVATSGVKPTSTKLSITDCTAIGFGPCSAVWLYDRSEAIGLLSKDDFTSLLQKSLSQTLSSYPHWAGQLSWDNSDPAEAGRRTAGRLVVSYGTSNDPGVEFRRVEYPAALKNLCPSVDERQGEDNRVWRWSAEKAFPQWSLLSPQQIAMDDYSQFEGLPAMTIQLTHFTDGGWSLGMKICHAIADTTSMTCFMREWSLRTQALLGNEGALENIQSPVFDPARLDMYAMPITLGEADEQKQRLARSLPMHRYSFWEMDVDGYADWARKETTFSKALVSEEAQKRQPQGIPMPWNTWDRSAKCAHAQIRFSSSELTKMRDAAKAGGSAPVNVSRLDAALAHVWGLVNKARGFSDSDEIVSLDVTLGGRSRLNPALPETFLGHPNIMAHLSLPGRRAAAMDGKAAGDLRRMMTQFTPEAMAAHLHDVAHDESPQRIWQGFLGKYHLLVTSWARAGVNDICFEDEGIRPRYVQGVMFSMDGLLAIYDLPERDGTMGLDFGLSLEEGTLEKVLEDPDLRKFR